MPELIPIDEAAKRLGRSVETVRDWTERGFAPTGVKVVAHRDTATKIRWYEPDLIERIRRSLYPSAARLSPNRS
jgi:transposase